MPLIEGPMNFVDGLRSAGTPGPGARGAEELATVLS